MKEVKVLAFSKESDNWEEDKVLFQEKVRQFIAEPKEKEQLFPINEKTLSCVQLALAQHYQDLETFYFDIFLKSENYNIICFVARRSLVLSEIFYAIWLYKHKIKEEQKGNLEIRNKFCSDTAFISMVGTWGSKVGEEELPAVLIVDELIMQGNSVNSILKELEQSLENAHINHGGMMTFSALQQELVRCISVRIFCGSVDSFVFHPNYQQKLLIETPASEAEWHRFSRNIAKLCQDLPVINTAFTLGIRLEPWMNKRLNFSVPKFQRCFLKHNELDECVFFYENDLGILGTVRGIYHKATQEISLIPLFFLPDCPKDIFLEIAEEIYERWFQTKDRAGFFPEDSHSYYEGIMLFLHCSLLQLFLKQAFQVDIRNFTLESFKIRANFAFNENAQWDSIQDNLVNPDILLGEEELLQYMNRMTQNHRNEESFDSLDEVQENQRAPALHHLENEVYQKKILEMQYFHKQQLGLYRTPNTSRTGRNFQIEEILGENPQRYKESKVFRAWMLQFMDRGILTMKIREEKDMVCQFLRTGEASVFLFPIRYQNFIPNLLYYERHSFGDKELFIQNMMEFQEEMKDIRPKLARELYDFYQYLSFSNQSLSAWDINLKTEVNYNATQIQ